MIGNIIIVTYNAENWIPKTFVELKAYKKYFNVIVVDNCSTDNTVKIIENDYSFINVHKLEDNIGFGAANNIGFKISRAFDFSHCLLLNQDAILPVDSALSLWKTGQNNKDYAVLSPVHLFNREKIDFFFLNNVLIKIPHYYEHLILKKKCKEVYEVPFVNAAIWLLDTKVYQELGGFDQLFRHYGEDDDYCFRVKRSGLKVGVCTEIFGFHLNRQERSPLLTNLNYQYGRLLRILFHSGGSIARRLYLLAKDLTFLTFSFRESAQRKLIVLKALIILLTSFRGVFKRLLNDSKRNCR